MRFRTLALAVALACGLAAMGEARQKPAVRPVAKHAKTVKGPKFAKTKPGKVKPFKANKYKYKASKRTYKRAKR